MSIIRGSTVSIFLKATCIDFFSSSLLGEVNTQPPGSKDPSTSGSANYITIITVTTIFSMLAFFVFVILCVSVRCIARQKRHRQRFHFPPTSKAGSSPPPRSDNRVNGFHLRLAKRQVPSKAGGTMQTNVSDHIDTNGSNVVLHLRC